MTGDLTLHGVTKPVTLDVTVAEFRVRCIQSIKSLGKKRAGDAGRYSRSFGSSTSMD